MLLVSVAEAIDLIYQQAPIDNPLKGIVGTTSLSEPSRASFPHSLLFENLPLNETMSGSTNFDWTKVDSIISSVTNDGSQIVLRFFMDYPGWTNTAIPWYLLTNNVKKVLVSEGDSITSYEGPGHSYPCIAEPKCGFNPWSLTNLGTSSYHFSQMTNRAANVDADYYTAGATNVISVLIGANDLNGMTLPNVTNYYNNLKGYFLDRRAVGWKTVICTVTPRTNAEFSSPRSTLNTLIRSDSSWYDAISDFAAHSTIGDDADAANTNYYSDGTHPTLAGETIMAGVYRGAVVPLFDTLSTTYYSDYGNTWSLKPNYEDPNLHLALTNFIAAFGTRYDGDPRIAFIQLGLLGMWGEWHGKSGEVPWSSTNSQRVVMDAYTNAFTQTKLSARYPAGTEHPYNLAEQYNCGGDIMAPNNNYPFGYYDDGICYSTLATNWSYYNPESLRPNTDYIWYQWQEMRLAECTNKWKQYPNGGEIGTPPMTGLFSNNIADSTSPYLINSTQTFSNCATITHLTYVHSWPCFYIIGLYDGGSYYYGEGGTNALQAAQLLGYELWAKSRSVWTNASGVQCRVVMTNTGVAPFYYNWQMQVKALTNSVEFSTYNPAWQLTSVVPGDGDVNFDLTLTNIPATNFTLLMRAVNPMSNGKPLRFANATMHETTTNWLTLGDVVYSDLTGSATRTNIHGKHSISGKFKLQ